MLPMQATVAQFRATFKEFSKRQKQASIHIAKMLAQTQSTSH